jgi:diguanylate cyclase (GGDEF)-like protein
MSRRDALVGRYGGDEFLAVLTRSDRHTAEAYVREVHAAAAHVPITRGEAKPQVPAEISIGLALYPRDADVTSDLIKLADTAMYETRRTDVVRGRKAA